MTPDPSEAAAPSPMPLRVTVSGGRRDFGRTLDLLAEVLVTVAERELRRDAAPTFDQAC